jgi:hypothetical protein
VTNAPFARRRERRAALARADPRNDVRDMPARVLRIGRNKTMTPFVAALVSVAILTVPTLVYYWYVENRRPPSEQH